MGKAEEKQLFEEMLLSSCVIFDQTTEVDSVYKYQCNPFLFFCVFVDLFFFSGRCGIQSKLIVRNGTTERAGIRESTVAAINGGKGPTAVDRKASTINQILFQKGIRL